jgi:hypothetical protein
MTTTHSSFRVAILAAAALILAGCGGDSKPATGILSFSMTDAPVDEADMVVIAMTEFELKPAGGPPFRVPVTEAGRVLNLLDFANGKKALIIDAEEVLAGEYDWLRIHFDMEDSYVRLKEGGKVYPLLMPSGEQTGYKLVSGFTVPVNRPVEYILDFNLRTSLIEPPGLAGPFGDRTFLLKPAIRIMNAEETGGVWGVVEDDLLALFNDEEDCAGGDAVYAFEGHDVDPLAAPPLVTDIVDFDTATGASEYHLMFLLPGAYTLAFTCSASADDGVAETYPLEDFADFGFSTAINVSVVSGELKQCDLPRDAEDPC